jgi:hypothetical protein
MHLLFYGLMSANGADMAANSPAAAVAAGVGRPARVSWLALDENRASAGRLIIICSLFVAFVAAALLAGGHEAIDPVPKPAVATPGAKGAGDIVFTMPDGIYCRHMSFDNATATIVEGGMEKCQTDIVRGRRAGARSFSWSTR